MDIPLILRSLPPLIIIEYVLINNANLLKNEELLTRMIVLNLSSYRIDLLNKLIDLLELDEQDLVANYALD